MFDQIEKELKTLVSKEQFENIVNSYEFSKSWKQTNTYYDTEEKDIKAKGGAMRIRKIGDKKIFTLKIRIDAITLHEYEKEIDCDSIEEIQDKEVLEWIKSLNLNKKFYATTTFDTYRRIYETENAELCADETIYDGTYKDYEIEYEYKKEHDGIKEFNSILSHFGLSYEKNCPSKIARAFNH